MSHFALTDAVEPSVMDPDFDVIRKSIERSDFIRHLEPNWDDEGGLPISGATWLRATEFLVSFYEWARETAGVVIPAPKIFPSSEGGIEISWRGSGRILLIFIPPEADVSAEYVAGCEGHTMTEGTLSTNTFDDPLHWSLLEYLKHG